MVLEVRVLEDADGEAEHRAGVPAAADDHGPVDGGAGAQGQAFVQGAGRGRAGQGSTGGGGGVPRQAWPRLTCPAGPPPRGVSPDW